MMSRVRYPAMSGSASMPKRSGFVCFSEAIATGGVEVAGLEYASLG